MAEIRDPDSQKGMKVDSKGRGVMFSEVVSDLEGISIDGNLWTIPLDGITTAGAANFMYLKNTGNNDIHISSIVMKSTAISVVQLKEVTGTPSGGCTIAIINRNLDKVSNPCATIEASASITGLTNGGIVYILGMEANAYMNHTEDSHMQIPPGKSVVLSIDVAATIDGYVTIYEEV